MKKSTIFKSLTLYFHKRHITWYTLSSKTFQLGTERTVHIFTKYFSHYNILLHSLFMLLNIGSYRLNKKACLRSNLAYFTGLFSIYSPSLIVNHFIIRGSFCIQTIWAKYFHCLHTLQTASWCVFYLCTVLNIIRFE